MNSHESRQKLGEELDALEAAADKFAVVFTQDYSLRVAYKQQVHEMAEAIFQAVERGEVTAESGARYAASVRNQIMAAVRRETSSLGRSLAEYHKEHGRAIYELLENYSQRKFGRPFRTLSTLQQHEVNLEVIRASGRTNAGVDRGLAKASRIGRGVLGLSLVFSFQNVRRSGYDVGVLLDEIGTHVGGGIGGAVGGVAARVLIGPAAPAFVIAGMFLGSFIAAEAAHRYIKSHLEF